MPSDTKEKLSQSEREVLLHIARASIAAAVDGSPLPVIDVRTQPEMLKNAGASFVTLTKNGNLRGCIGTMQPYQPLIEDVQEHAVAAAMSDFRFPPLKKDELPDISIEISRLTPLEKLEFGTQKELLQSLRIGVDGVLIRAGGRQATFLPQVWEQLPEPDAFLSQLCEKMGVDPGYWKDNPIDIYTYQVEKFGEK